MSAVRAALILSLSCLAASPLLAQSTWFVDVSAPPPGNGSPGSPYASIQYAHDQAATLSGDTLSIAAGSYREILTFAQGKALTLIGAGMSQTRLSGGLEVVGVPGLTRVLDLEFRDEYVRFDQSDVELTRVRVLDVGSISSVASIVVSGADSTWTDVIVAGNPGGGAGIFGGNAVFEGCSFVDQLGYAGGMFASSSTLTLSDCFFGYNHVLDGHGGGLHVDHCQTTLIDCEFKDNRASVDGRLGGAIYQGGGGQLTILGGRFEGNRADRGGALALLGPATLEDVTFQANVAQRDGSSAFMTGQGGAIYVSFAGTLTADDCQFLVNSAPEGLPLLPDDQQGGAIYAVGPGSKVTGSLFSDNDAGQAGSAVHGPVVLERCLVQKGVNTSAGGAVHGAALGRCTVFSNSTGSGSAAVVDCSVTNSIVWANPNGQLGGSSSATWSCIQGGAIGLGNLSADPLFADLGNDNVSLLAGSPCIDAASPLAPLDADLTPADMGALPFAWQPIGTSYCSTNPNSSGLTASIAALGSPSVAADFLRLQATQTAVNQVGLFLMSQNQGFVPFFNGSQGNLCVSAPIVRLTNTPRSVSSTGALGLLNLRVGLTTLPAGLQVLPGQTWHFQAWFRDTVAGNSTSNTTDAVSVTFQ
jgi:hypothetical protein